MRRFFRQQILIIERNTTLKLFSNSCRKSYFLYTMRLHLNQTVKKAHTFYVEQDLIFGSELCL